MGPGFCLYTVFSTHSKNYTGRFAMSMAPTTRYKISIELCRTKLLSLTFSFGAQGQGFQQLGLKFSIFQFFYFSQDCRSEQIADEKNHGQKHRFISLLKFSRLFSQGWRHLIQRQRKILTYRIKTLLEKDTYPWIAPLHHCKHTISLCNPNLFSGQENSLHLNIYLLVELPSKLWVENGK